MKLVNAIKFVRSVRPHHAQTFAKTVVPEVVRPARIIWNQVIGALFIVLAVPAFSKAFQAHQSQNDFVFVLSLIFGATMSSFGIASFLKARRIGSRR